MLSVGCRRNGSTTAVDGSGTRSMSDSWISWNPRIDEPSNPYPSSNPSSDNSCAGTEKCCINPGKSQKRKSTTSIPSSCTSRRTSADVRSSTDEPPQVLVSRRSLMWNAASLQGAAHRVGDQARDDVRVHVGIGPAVLD